MTLKNIIIVVTVILLAVMGWSVYNSMFSSDEGEIRELIDDIISDAQGDNNMIMAVQLQRRFSPNYRHDAGGETGGYVIDRSVVIEFLIHQKGQVDDMRIELAEEPVIKVDGETAEAILIGKVTAARKGNPAERFEIMTGPGWNKCILNFAKEDGTWVLTRSKRVEHTLGE